MRNLQKTATLALSLVLTLSALPAAAQDEAVHDEIRAMRDRAIAADGHFTIPDGRKSVSLVQPTYPTAEHYGIVFA